MIFFTCKVIVGQLTHPFIASFASKEAISEARKFSKTRQEGFRQSCDTGVVLRTEQNQAGHDFQWNEHQTLGNFFAVI